MTNRICAALMLMFVFCLFSLGKARAEAITKNPGWTGASLPEILNTSANISNFIRGTGEGGPGEVS